VKRNLKIIVFNGNIAEICIVSNVEKNLDWGNMMKDDKYYLDAVIDFIGYSDYWSGHGHAFEDENLKACIRFGIPIDYSEMVNEIIEMIMENINGYMCPFDWFTEDKQEMEEIEEFLTDEKLIESIKAIIKPEALKINDRMFYEDTEQEFKEVLAEEEKEYGSTDMMEYPMLIGWIHVYRNEEEER